MYELREGFVKGFSERVGKDLESKGNIKGLVLFFGRRHAVCLLVWIMVFLASKWRFQIDLLAIAVGQLFFVIRNPSHFNSWKWHKNPQ